MNERRHANQLQPIEHAGQRVLTTMQLAESFGTDSKVISKNFERNESRYIVGKHFFVLTGEDLKAFKASRQIDDNLKFASSLYVWTEKGAWLHAKSLNTDQAWEAYDMLVDDYYRIKQTSSPIDTSLLSPEMQMFKLAYDAMAKMQIEAAETQRQLAEHSQKVQAVESTVTAIKEAFLQRDENWRDSINKMLKAASFRSNGNYQELRAESYRLLEERGRCDLNRRVRFLRERLQESGATKTKINSVGRMDVIEADNKLREIYTTIVKELSIGTLI